MILPGLIDPTFLLKLKYLGKKIKIGLSPDGLPFSILHCRSHFSGKFVALTSSSLPKSHPRPITITIGHCGHALWGDVCHLPRAHAVPITASYLSYYYSYLLTLGRIIHSHHCIIISLCFYTRCCGFPVSWMTNPHQLRLRTHMNNL